MSTPENSGQGMSAAFIEQIRQKLGLNLQALLTATKAAATYLTPAQAAAAYQPLSTAILKNVLQNGVAVVNPTLASGANLITSTGAATYTINYGVTYAVAPSVVAWCSTDSAGNVTVADLSSVGTSSFTLAAIIPGVGVVPSPRTFTVGWMAVGA